jgi:hypothetical protein
MKISQSKRLIQLVTDLLEVPEVNAIRYGNNAVDALACEIETLLTELGCFVEDKDGQTVLAARFLGRKGGKVRSEAKTKAVRANGASGGRPRSAGAKPESVKRREKRRASRNQ